MRDVELADGVVALIAGTTAGEANSTVVLRDGDAAVVDTLLLPGLAADIHDVLHRRGARATTVLNTHPHIDHVGGNGAFPDARVIAPAATADSVRRLAADTSFLARLFPNHSDQLADLRLRVPEAVHGEFASPVPAAEVLLLGPAHTPVDLALWLPEERLLIAGDLCVNGIVPLALPGHADIAGWIAALETLIGLAPAVVVPGHGEPGGVEVLHTNRAYLTTVLGMAERAVAEHTDPHEFAHQADWACVRGWAQPDRTALNLAVAVAGLTGDRSRLPAGIPAASRTPVVPPAEEEPR